jgi:hypothetical protein
LKIKRKSTLLSQNGFQNDLKYLLKLFLTVKITSPSINTASITASLIVGCGWIGANFVTSGFRFSCTALPEIISVTQQSCGNIRHILRQNYTGTSGKPKLSLFPDAENGNYLL